MSNNDLPTHQARLRETVQQFEGPLIRYAARMLGDVERARDVAQDVFLRMCAQPPEKLRDNPGPWLFTVCRNRALDVLKKEARMSTIDDQATSQVPSPQPDQQQAVEQHESAGLATQILQQLPANQQEVIRLKIQEDLSYREISQVTGLSVSNVGYLLHTGLKSIRQRMA